MNADELKKADEIVRALRDYAADCDDCFECIFAGLCDICGNTATKVIVDLIDSLTAQLAESQRREKAAEDCIRSAIEKAPTVPAEVVVHCENCQHYQEDNINWCTLDGTDRNPTDYCSYGERGESEAGND